MQSPERPVCVILPDEKQCYMLNFRGFNDITSYAVTLSKLIQATFDFFLEDPKFWNYSFKKDGITVKRKFTDTDIEINLKDNCFAEICLALSELGHIDGHGVFFFFFFFPHFVQFPMLGQKMRKEIRLDRQKARFIIYAAHVPDHAHVALQEVQGEAAVLLHFRRTLRRVVSIARGRKAWNRPGGRMVPRTIPIINSIRPKPPCDRANVGAGRS